MTKNHGITAHRNTVKRIEKEFEHCRRIIRRHGIDGYIKWNLSNLSLQVIRRVRYIGDVVYFESFPVW